jgi:E3 ubiquitin-protein ligase HECTD1
MLCHTLQVAKQWYDFERSTFHFVKLAKKLKSPLTFRRVTDFDDNGILYWIGSNGK